MHVGNQADLANHKREPEGPERPSTMSVYSKLTVFDSYLERRRMIKFGLSKKSKI